MADTPAAAAVEAVKASQTPETPASAPTASLKPVDQREQEFARKERQLRKMQQEIQAEKQRWMAERDQEKAKYESEYIPKSRIVEDPLSALTDLGLSYDQLTQMILTGHNSQDPAIKALRAEIRAMKDAQAKQAEEAQASTKTQYEAAVKQISNEVKMLVDANSEYESIKQAGMQDAVVELITQTFDSEGYLMDVEEAARQVENHLLEEAVRLASLSKVQQRLKPQTPETPVQEPSQAPAKPQSQPQPTLTNKMQATPTKKLTDKERRERAMAAFYGKNIT